MRKKEGWSKENWKRGRGRENDETQRGSGQGWMGVKGDRESGRGGGDRSVSVKDETPKQVSKRQTDRQTEYIKYGGRGDEHLHQTQPRTKNT